MKTFTHYNARSIKEATDCLEIQGQGKAERGGHRPFGLHERAVLSTYPEAIIDLKAINGLDYIRRMKTG